LRGMGLATRITERMRMLGAPFHSWRFEMPPAVRYLTAGGSVCSAVGLVTLALIVLGISPASGSTDKMRKVVAPCASGSVSAVIAGERVCLRRGQRCSKRRDREYHRYGFHCHSGRLIGGPKPPKPLPPAGRVVAILGVPSTGGIAFGAGSVWIANNGPHTITRVDPERNAIVGTIPISDPLADPLHGPTLLAFDHGSLWVLDGAADCSCVRRVDPSTNRIVTTIPLGSPTQFRVAPLGIATTPEAVWVTDRWGTEEAPAGSVVRVDPGTNRIVAILGIGSSFEGNSGPTGIAGDSTAMWVGVPSMRSVVRINALTNSVDVRTPGFTCVEGQLAADESAVWVADCDAVRQINTQTGAIAKTIRIPGHTGNDVRGVGVKYGSLWIQAGRLFRLDPVSGVVTGSLPLPPALVWSEYNLAFGFGSVWVRRVDQLVRIEP
jgi:streptogramin lyase